MEFLKGAGRLRPTAITPSGEHSGLPSTPRPPAPGNTTLSQRAGEDSTHSCHRAHFNLPEAQLPELRPEATVQETTGVRSRGEAGTGATRTHTSGAGSTVSCTAGQGLAIPGPVGGAGWAAGGRSGAVWAGKF